MSGIKHHDPKLQMTDLNASYKRYMKDHSTVEE